MAYTLARIKDILENHDDVVGLELDGLYIDMHQRMVNRRGQPGAFYPLHHIAPESCFCKHCRRLAKEEDIEINLIEKTVRELTRISLDPSHEIFYKIFDYNVLMKFMKEESIRKFRNKVKWWT